MKDMDGTDNGKIVHLEDYRIRPGVHRWARDRDMHRSPDVR